MDEIDSELRLDKMRGVGKIFGLESGDVTRRRWLVRVVEMNGPVRMKGLKNVDWLVVNGADGLEGAKGAYIRVTIRFKSD
jgi:hypothetical protein